MAKKKKAPGPAWTYPAVVAQVTDGDTVLVDIDLGLSTWQRGVPVRLYGINAPETRGASRVAGWAARDFLRTLLYPGGEITIKTYKAREKFGRYLAEIWTADGLHVNAEMLKRGHATEYFGGAR